MLSLVMTSDAVIIDGYIDEPACLGVPPYISPYVRYMAGVLTEHGYSIRYATIDQVREEPSLLASFNDAAVVVMIAGTTVPGRYLGGAPATLTEIRQIGMQMRSPASVIGGPIVFGYAGQGGRKAIKEEGLGFDLTLTGSPAAALDAWLNGGEPAGSPDYRQIDHWSVSGSGVIRQHPSFPHIMIELETATGCPRAVTGGCSFCTEPFYGMPEYRSIDGCADEVAALHRAGARHFRLGRQPDLIAYGAGGGEFPEPRPDLIRELFTSIRDAAPDLKTLHIDNINPGTIAHHEEASRAALEAIVDLHTPGDVAAFGMETADPAVMEANNLKAYPDEVFRAIRIVNEVGARRRDGVPELLPGLNFIIGLSGETERTFALNEEFLKEVLDAGLMVRRVNIRQVMPFEGTPAYEDNTLGMHESRFRQFKEHVRKHFDHPMLKLVFPAGTILREVIIEAEGSPSYGRPMGSYPILAGIPLRLPAGTVMDVVVVSHGMRSLTALPYPVDLNHLPAGALQWLPGIGKKRARSITAKRGYRNLEEFRADFGITPLDAAFVFRLP